jgi:linoleoyl-CoA desaturase
MAKLVYYTMMLVLPILLSPVAWWVTLLFFLSMHFIAGVILSSIFQSAHVMPQVRIPNGTRQWPYGDQLVRASVADHLQFQPKESHILMVRRRIELSDRAPSVP